MFIGRCQDIQALQFEEQQNKLCLDQKRLITIKNLHEELVLQWAVAPSSVRHNAASNQSR